MANDIDKKDLHAPRANLGEDYKSGIEVCLGVKGDYLFLGYDPNNRQLDLVQDPREVTSFPISESHYGGMALNKALEYAANVLVGNRILLYSVGRFVNKEFTQITPDKLVFFLQFYAERANEAGI